MSLVVTAALLAPPGCPRDDGPAATVAPEPEPPATTTADTGPSFALVGQPLIVADADPDVHLVASVRAETSAPTWATLWIDDPCGTRRVSFPQPATAHVLPVLGLHADAAHTVRLSLTDGHTTVDVDLGTHRTDPVALAPQMTIYAHDPARMEPGLLILPFDSAPGTEVILALDEQLHVVYAMDRGASDVRLDADGTWLVLRLFDIVRWRTEGELVEQWSSPDQAYHHEAFPLSDGGLLTLGTVPATVAEYPLDVELSGYGAATLTTQTILRFDAAGQQVEEHRLVDLLDTRRIGFLSVSDPGETQDWSHANAVVPWGDDAYLVSVRHLDLVVCLGRDGAVRWLLGDPTGWTTPWADLFLQPTAPMRWPSHQHAPEVHGSTIVLFDNGNFDGTPYRAGDPAYVPNSRAVAYDVDEGARTVTERWSLGHEGLFTYAMGDADWLPQTGNVQMVFSMVAEPVQHPRVVQLHPDRPDEPALDVAFRPGIRRNAYRARNIPHLYPSDVIDERL